MGSIGKSTAGKERYHKPGNELNEVNSSCRVEFCELMSEKSMLYQHLLFLFIILPIDTIVRIYRFRTLEKCLSTPHPEKLNVLVGILGSTRS